MGHCLDEPDDCFMGNEEMFFMHEGHEDFDSVDSSMSISRPDASASSVAEVLSSPLPRRTRMDIESPPKETIPSIGVRLPVANQDSIGMSSEEVLLRKRASKKQKPKGYYLQLQSTRVKQKHNADEDTLEDKVCSLHEQFKNLLDGTKRKVGGLSKMEWQRCTRVMVDTHSKENEDIATQAIADGHTESQGGMTWYEKFSATRESMKALPALEQVRVLLLSGLRVPDAAPLLNQYLKQSSWLLEALMKCELQQEKDGKATKASVLLLTYHNDSWCIQNPEVDGSKNIDMLVEGLQSTPRVMKIIDDIKTSVAVLAEKHLMKDYSVSLEVCSRTCSAAFCRMHLHLGVVFACSAEVGRRPAKFKILGAVPFVDTNDAARVGMAAMGRGGGPSATKAAAAHYYCAAPKIGQVMSYSTVEAHVDYRVKPMWITNMVSANKMTPAKARLQYAKALQGLIGNMNNLKKRDEVSTYEVDDAELQTILETIASRRQRFRDVPAVKDEWLKQYEVVRDRYKFLVLCGPSRTGKTVYCRHMFGDAGKVLEVNCASGAEPNLRPFLRAKHQGILFDEATPALVLRQKKMFQAPACWLDLGGSTTNCHAYPLMLSGTKMMICSNTWDEHLQELGEADRDWLIANSVCVEVLGPLWLKD